jgi:1-acyl-sn-glycerol-3-phosphate acyltransferase
MVLKAKHNFFIYPFFKWYARRSIKKHFGVIQIIGEFNDKKLPVLLISNHISWWDGFWADYVNQKLFRRTFHFMMLEEQLRKYWFFNYAGGYSVKKKSRSIIETLDYTSELLSDPENLVLIFPQGELQSMHNKHIQFERGLERILKNRIKKIQIVFLVNLVDYFSSQKPGIYFYMQEYSDDDVDVQSIQKSYNMFYSESIEIHKKLIAEQ